MPSVKTRKIASEIYLKSLRDKCVRQTLINYGFPSGESRVLASTVAYDLKGSTEWDEPIYRVPVIVEEAGEFFYIQTLHGANGQAKLEEGKFSANSPNKLAAKMKKFCDPKVYNQVVKQLFESLKSRPRQID